MAIKQQKNPLQDLPKHKLEYLVYDLGHTPETIIRALGIETSSLQFRRGILRYYGLDFGKIKIIEVTQYFRLMKYWGLNAAEVMHYLLFKTEKTPEYHPAMKLHGFTFPEGHLYKKNNVMDQYQGTYYFTKDFVEFAINRSMGLRDIVRILPDTPAFRRRGIKEKMRKNGVTDNQIGTLEAIDLIPIAQRISEEVLRDEQEGFDKTLLGGY